MIKKDINTDYLESDILPVNDVVRRRILYEFYKESYDEDKEEMIRQNVELHEERDNLLRKVNNSWVSIALFIGVCIGFAVGFAIFRI